MKLFLTGASGFIGTNFIKYFNNYEIFQFSKGQDFLQDINYFKPDIIINAGAEIYLEQYMWDSNVLLTKQCVEYVKDNPYVKMIQIGSSSEYGILNKPGSELDPISPIDIYQTTKGISTLICQGYARNYKLDINILRPYSLYGPHEKPHRLFPRLWKAFILDQPMVLYDGYHDFIYIDDFLRALKIVIDKGQIGVGDIINCGSGIQISNFEVYNLFKKLTGKEAPVTLDNKMAKKFESSIWLCNTDYANKKYNFKTEINLEQGTKSFLSLAKYSKEK